VAVIDNYIYVFGGLNASGTAINKIQRASVSTPTVWSDTGATLPGILSHSSFAIVGSKMWLFGGWAGSVSNTIYSAPVSNPLSWINTGSILPVAMGGASVLIMGNFVYLLNGYNWVTAYNSIYYAPQRNPSVGLCTFPTSVPTTASFRSIYIVGDTAYLSGGVSSNCCNTIDYTKAKLLVEALGDDTFDYNASIAKLPDGAVTSISSIQKLGYHPWHCDKYSRVG
jgi:Kelch motif.